MRHAFLTTILLSSSAWAQSGDFNTDGVVDLQDFFAFAEVSRDEATGTNGRFDLDSNATIDLADFFLFAQQFGEKVASGRSYRGFGSHGFAEVEVTGVLDGTGFGEIAVIGFFDTTDVIEVWGGGNS